MSRLPLCKNLAPLRSVVVKWNSLHRSSTFYHFNVLYVDFSWTANLLKCPLYRASACHRFSSLLTNCWPTRNRSTYEAPLAWAPQNYHFLIVVFYCSKDFRHIFGSDVFLFAAAQTCFWQYGVFFPSTLNQFLAVLKLWLGSVGLC